ncbi:thioredoxin [Chlorobaculum limnaeum]|uniref:Thioredoxin n=1 Tax=Chlorobaculum limnaeum TaxID=274537 RepID=A0A1D8D6K1_CHLLM|nr:thioredoxin [Chlorobaculum limnaeum]AOS83808.1 thioredoxin [Chlorobaculum limnaeum]
MQSSTPFDFQTDVIELSKTIPVLVDFWAQWCGPCRILAPVLKRLADRHAGKWVLVKVNTEEYPEISAQYGIRGIPNVKLFSNGEVIEEFTGALPEHQIEQWLSKALPSPWAEDVERAATEIAAGDNDAAVFLLEGVLANEPENRKAAAMLVKLILFSRPDEALRLAEPLEAEPEYADLSEAVRTLGALLARPSTALPKSESLEAYGLAVESLRKGDLDRALERFIAVLRDDRYYDGDGSRKACIAIFRLLGEEHEITMKHRQAFDRAF